MKSAVNVPSPEKKEKSLQPNLAIALCSYAAEDLRVPAVRVWTGDVSLFAFLLRGVYSLQWLMAALKVW